MTAICNARVLLPEGVRDDVTVHLDGERISAVESGAPPAGSDTVDLDGQLLVPGFIDLQVNGGGGVLFNDDPSVETIRKIAEAHRPFGTTALLPTLISDDLDKVAAAIAAVDEAILAGVPGIIGIHIEGPFLCPARKGVHDESKFRQLGDDEVELLSSLKHGRTLVTVAPDVVAPDKIGALVDRGIVVAAGHSNASFEQTATAIDAGLRGFTHLYNAMSPLTAREPGVVGAALVHDDCWCGIIADGFHVHPDSLKVALRAKPRGKLVLVTDAMPGVGSDQDSFVLNGERIDIVDGRCATKDGTLAGSNLDMASAVRYAHEDLGLDSTTAIEMATLNPAMAIGANGLGTIEAGATASLVSLDDNLQVTGTWINGQAGVTDA